MDTNNILFGELVSFRRNKLNMSMRDLAQKADVDVAYLSRLEKNSRNINPGFAVVIRIAKVLDISMQSILETFNFDPCEIEVADDSNVIKNRLLSETKKSSYLEEISVTENEILSDILTDLLDLRNKPKTDFAGIIHLIEDIQQLFKQKKSDTFYIIAKTEEDHYEVLRTPVYDKKLKHLYLQALNAKEDGSYAVEANNIEFPSQYIVRSVDELFEYWDTLASADFYEDIVDYIKEFKKHYFSLSNGSKQS